MTLKTASTAPWQSPWSSSYHLALVCLPVANAATQPAKGPRCAKSNASPFGVGALLERLLVRFVLLGGVRVGLSGQGCELDSGVLDDVQFPHHFDAGSQRFGVEG